MSFVFYDVETTGTDHAFDQILQFAAILTDPDLNELDRFEVRCRLLPHVVPSPGALAVTRVPIARALDPALPSHYEMICSIADRLARWSPSIFLGWNTLGFDEHLLRQALYQCLHPPYLTSTDGNSRTDLLKLSQALGVLKPDVLTVPVGASGKPSYKLDRLAPANGFDHSNAHDAMADVEATIHIGRIVRDRAPDLWSDAVRFSQKAAAVSFIGEEPAFVLTESHFGRPYQYALAPIGSEPDSSTVLAYDLEVDPAALMPLGAEALAARLRQSPRPVRRVATNAAPMMSRVDAFPTFHGIPPDVLIARAETVRSDKALCARLCGAMARDPYPGAEHVELRIHEGFASNADRARMRAFHLADWPSRIAIVDSFEDARLAELGRRLVFHHAPEALSREAHRALAIELARRMTGEGHDAPPWLTLPAADEEAVRMLGDCTAEEKEILTDLRRHYAAQASRCATQLLQQGIDP
jgi:exodeoxyribonuclease-1